jgi:hypothetical protein
MANTLTDLTAERGLLERASNLMKMAAAEYLSRDGMNGVTSEFRRLGGVTKAPSDAVLFDDAERSAASRAFIELVDRRSILGQIRGAIRTRPAITGRRVLSQPVGGWVGEAAPRPVTGFSFDDSDLGPLSISTLTVASDEFLRRRDVDAIGLIQRGLLNALAALTDVSLLAPTSTAIPDVRPASITAGLSATITNANVAACAASALHAISSGAPAAPHLAVSFKHALGAPSLIRDLRDVGVVVLITPAAGDHVIAFDGSRLILAVGEARVDWSRAASVEMDTTPDGSGAVVSMFQSGAAAFKAARTLNWRAGVDAVAFSTVGS